MSFRGQLQQVPSPMGPDLSSTWVRLPVGRWSPAAPQNVGEESGLDSLAPGGVLSAHPMYCLYPHKTVGADLQGEGEETAAVEYIFHRGHWPTGGGKDGHIRNTLSSLHLPGKERSYTVSHHLGCSLQFPFYSHIWQQSQLITSKVEQLLSVWAWRRCSSGEQVGSQ